MHIVKYWVTSVYTHDNKYIGSIYDIILRNGMEVYSDNPNWCTLLTELLCTLGMNGA